MNNLEQIRASNALAYAHGSSEKVGKEGGNVLKKLPALVMTNGLLAAGAFAYAQKDNGGWQACFDHIARHLSHKDVSILPSSCSDLRSMMEVLSTRSDSQTLKVATEESLAWLSYARRFVKPETGESHDSNE